MAAGLAYLTVLLAVHLISVAGNGLEMLTIDHEKSVDVENMSNMDLDKYADDTRMGGDDAENLGKTTSEERMAILLSGSENLTSIFDEIKRTDRFDNMTIGDDIDKYGKKIEVGDILFREEQYEILFGKSEGNRTRRGAAESAVINWPNGVIIYEFEYGHFDFREETDIRKAMDLWESLTCVKFQHINRGNPEKTYLTIRRSLVRCTAELGYPGYQQKSLMFLHNDFMAFGYYLHELGHVIGLVHEHNLPNRDQYIQILWGNIYGGDADKFQKYNRDAVNFYGSSYDLSSVMHNSHNAFSIDPSISTFTVPDRWMLRYIGQQKYRRILSFSDILVVNKLYKCGKACVGKAFCPATGFLNKHCGCYTLSDYYQTYCRNSEAYEQECYKIAIAGKCDPENENQHKHCAKACDFCPRFLPGQKVQPPAACRNLHPDPAKCPSLATPTSCRTSKFLERYCAKSCGTCKESIARCPNLAPDIKCDKAESRCKSRSTPENEILRGQCQSTCNTCMYRHKGEKCENEAADNWCEAKRLEGACDIFPAIMSVQCRSTCNLCWFNGGEEEWCKNRLSARECEKFALMNYCTGGPNKETMKIRCAKTCNTCYYAMWQTG